MRINFAISQLMIYSPRTKLAHVESFLITRQIVSLRRTFAMKPGSVSIISLRIQMVFRLAVKGHQAASSWKAEGSGRAGQGKPV